VAGRTEEEGCGRDVWHRFAGENGVVGIKGSKQASCGKPSGEEEESGGTEPSRPAPPFWKETTRWKLAQQPVKGTTS
jgi:hypothetical protein